MNRERRPRSSAVPSQSRSIPRLSTEPDQLDEDLHVAVERGAGRVGRAEEDTRAAALLEREHLRVQPDERPTGIAR